MLPLQKRINLFGIILLNQLLKFLTPVPPKKGPVTPILAWAPICDFCQMFKQVQGFGLSLRV